MNGHSVRAQYTKNLLRVWLVNTSSSPEWQKTLICDGTYSIEHARVWEMESVHVRTPGGGSVKLSDGENIDAPGVVKQ